MDKFVNFKQPVFFFDNEYSTGLLNIPEESLILVKNYINKPRMFYKIKGSNSSLVDIIKEAEELKIIREIGEDEFPMEILQELGFSKKDVISQNCSTENFNKKVDKKTLINDKEINNKLDLFTQDIFKNIKYINENEDLNNYYEAGVYFTKNKNISNIPIENDGLLVVHSNFKKPEDISFIYGNDVNLNNTPNYFKETLSYNNKIYLIPENSNYIRICNEDGELLKDIELDNNYFIQDKFIKSFIKNDKLYLIPNNYNKIVIFDLINETKLEIGDYNRNFKLFSGYEFFNDELYLIPNKYFCIEILDLETNALRSIKITDNDDNFENKFINPIKDSENLYLIFNQEYDNNFMIKINKNEHSYIRYYEESKILDGIYADKKEIKKDIFEKSFILDDYIICLSKKYGNLIYDKNQEIFRYEPYELREYSEYEKEQEEKDRLEFEHKKEYFFEKAELIYNLKYEDYKEFFTLNNDSDILVTISNNLKELKLISFNKINEEFEYVYKNSTDIEVNSYLINDKILYRFLKNNELIKDDIILFSNEIKEIPITNNINFDCLYFLNNEFYILDSKDKKLYILDPESSTDLKILENLNITESEYKILENLKEGYLSFISLDSKNMFKYNLNFDYNLELENNISNSRVFQFYTSNSLEVYKRHFDGKEWKEWSEIYSDINPQPMDEYYKKVESDERFTSRLETNLGKDFLEETYIFESKEDYLKPIGTSLVFQKNGSLGLPDDFRSAVGFYFVLGSHSNIDENASGRISFLISNTKDFNDIWLGYQPSKQIFPRWKRIFNESTPPNFENIGVFSKTETIKRLNDSEVPIGTILNSTLNYIDGCIKCNGQLINEHLYPELIIKLGSEYAPNIGYSIIKGFSEDEEGNEIETETKLNYFIKAKYVNF